MEEVTWLDIINSFIESAHDEGIIGYSSKEDLLDFAEEVYEDAKCEPEYLN